MHKQDGTGVAERAWRQAGFGTCEGHLDETGNTAPKEDVDVMKDVGWQGVGTG